MLFPNKRLENAISILSAVAADAAVMRIARLMRFNINRICGIRPMRRLRPAQRWSGFDNDTAAALIYDMSGTHQREKTIEIASRMAVKKPQRQSKRPKGDLILAPFASFRSLPQFWYRFWHRFNSATPSLVIWARSAKDLEDDCSTLVARLSFRPIPISITSFLRDLFIIYDIWNYSSTRRLCPIKRAFHTHKRRLQVCTIIFIWFHFDFSFTSGALFALSLRVGRRRRRSARTEISKSNSSRRTQFTEFQ